MELSKIASNQVNFQANKAATTAPQPKKQTQEQQTKYAVGALAALALIGTTIAVVHKIRHGKDATKEGQKLIEEGQKIAENVQETTKLKINLVTKPQNFDSKKAFELVDQRSGIKAAESAAVFIQKGALEATPAELAQAAVEEGKPISSIRKVTRNMPKAEAKKVNAEISQARDAAEKGIAEIRQSIKQVNTTKTNATKKIEHAERLVENAKTVEEIDAALVDIDEKTVGRMQKASTQAQSLSSASPKVAKEISEAQVTDKEVEAIQERLSDLRQTAEKAKEAIASEAEAKAARQAAIEANPKQLANLQQGGRTRVGTLLERKTKNGKMTTQQALEEIIANKEGIESKYTIEAAQKRLADLQRTAK
ncbi:hypothetical protein IJX73_00630 [bacterium]|nr:hypothetical protein [bacterium]MBQ9149415.1 hypothetical protein [bacterium]